jgi:Enoyl-CoA hydratase/isomerase
VATVSLDDDALDELIGSPYPAEELATAHGVTTVVVPGDASPDAARVVGGLQTVVIGFGFGALAEACDVIASDHESLSALTTAIAANPLASFALVALLRGADGRSIADGLAAESAVYSMLLAGPEFARWRHDHAARPQPQQNACAVGVQRDGSHLTIELNRPERHNAFDVAMRDGLYDAMLLAVADSSITRVTLSGRGASFCSGGDLDTFGSAPDVGNAHAIRLARSCGRLLAALANRVEVRLHGACFGAGIELPAFAGRVIATSDAVTSLPEISLGLIPGAGGTVSLPRRIGRQRTAYLALTGARLDAATAHAWGLIDTVDA